ncbi:hypothetical protein GCM10019016_104850 [Streptomyces prasinosporus]|uniref:Uncharacterized protein n=1 Tax=Streptomyces prasinosporus TaxID=68256 RepID=A0ABP6U8X5_9ACTN
MASHATGPYLFVAEAVLPYLHELDARGVIDLLADRVPGTLPALDTAGPGFFATSGTARRPEQGRGPYAPVLPRPNWPAGRRVHAYRYPITLAGLSEDLVAQMPLPYQQMVSAIAARRRPRAEDYRLSLLRLP